MGHHTAALTLIVFLRAWTADSDLLLDAPMTPGTGSTKRPPMNRPRLLQRVLRDCYCRLQPSKVDGIGVFAIRNIPSGVDPFKTIAKYAQPGYVQDYRGRSSTGFRRVSLADCCGLSSCPARAKMDVPTCGTNVIYLNAYLNHSSRPNMRTQDGYTFTTRRMISTRGGIDSGLSDVWRRGSPERSPCVREVAA